MIKTPEDLQSKLLVIIPELEEELIEDDEYDYGFKYPLTYHQIWMAFAPIAHKSLSELNTKILKKFCEIINYMIDEGGDKENSVSTCLLEHASQIKINKIIKPYLSAKAKLELH